MFNFFKRNKNKPLNYIVFLEKYKDVVFNLNLIRKGGIDLQVYNQALNINNDLISIDNENGLTIVFSFSSTEDESFLRFKESEFYDEIKSDKIKKYNKYVFNIDYDVTYLYRILKFSTEEIYKYSNETNRDTEFFLFMKNGETIDVRSVNDIPNIEDVKKINNYLK